MREMTLQDIQRKSLEMMKHVDEFCSKNSIIYSLMGGSLIGAVRHKGFIPWDDDLDIMMPRTEYDRFCALYKDNEQYKLFCPERHNNYTPYARLCDIKDTYVRTKTPIATEEAGIWIDIFPIDFVDDDKEVCLKKNMRLKKMSHILQIRRHTIAPFGYYGYSVKLLCKQLIKKLVFRRNILDIVNDYSAFCRTYCTNPTHHAGVLSVSRCVESVDRQYFPKKIIYDTIKTPFEETEFSVLKNYDVYLRIIWGDYMKLPPEEKRKGHTFHKFYWKE